MFRIVLARAVVLVLALGLVIGWASQEPPIRRDPPRERRDAPRQQPNQEQTPAQLAEEQREEELAPQRRRADRGPRADEDLVRRGEYIARDVAMCVHCHTPRRPDGSLDEARLLHGAAMPIASPFPRQVWCFYAPRLAGLPGGWPEEELIEFLQTGHTERRPPARPPMPPFRLTEQDAAAVAAYLASLR